MSDLIVPELQEPVDALLAEGFHVYAYAYDDGRRPRRGGWVVVERDGDVGSLQYDRLDGYRAVFSIRPSRETGSGLMVDEPMDTVDDIVAACRIATSPSYGNFATPGRALPNDGWAHFRWARNRLVPLGDSPAVEHIEPRSVAR